MYTGGIIMLPLSESSYQSVNNSQTKLNRFLVCGLGSLGQHCVAILKEYGVVVSAIDLEAPKNWQIPNFSNLLEQLLIGDCRQTSILEQADIRQCRTVLLLTGNERVNIEAAFAARLLNPQVRLVVRSDKQNLNELLSQNIGNFIAFEPNQLSASGFAVAALGDNNLGCFHLDGRQFRVIKHQIKTGDSWSKQRYIYELNTSSRRVLNHSSSSSHVPKEFHNWEPDAKLHPGDTLIYVEVAENLANSQQLATQSKYNWLHLWRGIISSSAWNNFKQKIAQLWQKSDRYQSLRVAIICSTTVLLLWCCGTVFYSLYFPGINIFEAFYATAVLLLGGYGDLFGGVKFETEHMPGWLRLFSLGLTLIGTGFVGVLYALLTDTLLSLRFQGFTRDLPLMPQKNYVVLIGFNQVGERIATLLQELKQPVVGISTTPINTDFITKIPLIISSIPDALGQVNLANSKSIVVVTDDDMENLEIALMAHSQSPSTPVVIRTYDRYFSDNVARLFPYAQVLCTSAISAEVFAAAAFGEKILSLFHFDSQTILVVEYMIESEDTLNGLLLAEVAYGYGVIPLLHQKFRQLSVKLMPSDDTRLAIGDRLIVLANSNSLQQIERGEMFMRTWQLQIEKALSQDAIFEGANEISVISGCNISTARKLMNNLPGYLPIALYQHQATRLLRRLSKLRVTASLRLLNDEIEN